jgi:site-specific DNA-methyltransferase (adenine-specific)/adenine-specific DNA-methyltransferase
MPTLDWIGKRAVVNHHRALPYRLLRCEPAPGAGDPAAGNLLVEGDNLHALKALLPYYAGRVKCIYIDPPYNTGNEGWVYNDAVNAPEIQKWLGEIVGKEAEDLSRHDKWLCMMYPRLALLREFLRDDGSIFISIDDNEVQNLRGIMDEIFGQRNFVATVIWQKVYSPKNSARHFSEDHDYIICYARDAAAWQPNLIPRNDEQDKAYKNRDNDPRGPWKTGDLSARNFYGAGTYSITCPSGRVISHPPTGMYWRVSKDKFSELDADRRIWWGKDGNAIPQIKRFLAEVKQGVVPQTLWFYSDVGHTQDAKKELLGILDFADSESVFITPKPTLLVKRIVQLATNPGDLILDSFAGSGTTGHAVLALNKEDGGNRHFILCELEPKIARDITAERLRRVIAGHGDTPGLGGGFRFCTLGEPLFNEDGHLRVDVTWRDLAHHVWFTETGTPISRAEATPEAEPALRDSPAGPSRPASPLVGVAADGRAVHLLFNGILGDRRPTGGNVLTAEILAGLAPHDGPRVVYGEACTVRDATLARARVVFRQIPYQVRQQ